MRIGRKSSVPPTSWDARLADLAVVRRVVPVDTPLIAVDGPNGSTVLLKLELAQPIKSFKLRGAAVALGSGPAWMRERGVVADSGGNHAQAVAFAGTELDVPVRIVMPGALVPSSKQRATRRLGAPNPRFALDLSPADFVTAKAVAKRYASDHDAYYLSPYDDDLVIRGTATIVPELVGQFGDAGLVDVTGIHVPVGGGGLISGIADVNAELGAPCEVVGYGMTGADSFARSMARRTRDTATPVDGEPDTIVEGLSVTVIGDRAYERIRAGRIARAETLTLAETGAAYAWYREAVLPLLGVDTADEEAVWSSVPELSSMVAVAGLLRHLVERRDETHVVVITGGNIDRAKIGRALDAAGARSLPLTGDPGGGGGGGGQAQAKSPTGRPANSS